MCDQARPSTLSIRRGVALDVSFFSPPHEREGNVPFVKAVHYGAGLALDKAATGMDDGPHARG